MRRHNVRKKETSCYSVPVRFQGLEKKILALLLYFTVKNLQLHTERFLFGVLLNTHARAGLGGGGIPAGGSDATGDTETQPKTLQLNGEVTLQFY